MLEGSACARLLEKEEESAKQRYQRAKSTCEELIEQLDPREADRRPRAASGFPRAEAQATGRERSPMLGLRPCLGPRKAAAADLLHRSGEWPAVRSGGRAVNPEGEGQQSHGEADAAGPTRGAPGNCGGFGSAWH